MVEQVVIRGAKVFLSFLDIKVLDRVLAGETLDAKDYVRLEDIVDKHHFAVEKNKLKLSQKGRDSIVDEVAGDQVAYARGME